MAVDKSTFSNQQRVVIIDGDEDEACLLSSQLELNGFRVWMAEEAGKGIAIYKEFQPGIIFVDANLPSKSWITCIESIRKYEVELDSDYRCMIFLTTGRFSTELNEKAHKIGVSDVIGKPIDKNSLLQKIKDFQSMY